MKALHRLEAGGLSGSLLHQIPTSRKCILSSLSDHLRWASHAQKYFFEVKCYSHIPLVKAGLGVSKGDV